MVRKRHAALAVLAVVVLGGATPATAGQRDSAQAHSRAAESCRFLEKGPPGPRGDVLEVNPGAYPVIELYREGRRIRVFEVQTIAFYRDAIPLRNCSGATVANIDRIHISAPRALVVNLSGRKISVDGRGPTRRSAGGPLGPGATRESHGSEIEVTMAPSKFDSFGFVYLGSRRADSISVGRLASGGVGANLDVGADGGHPDLDVIRPSPHAQNVRGGNVLFVGFGGSDRFDGGGKDRPYARPLERDSQFTLVGGRGDDVLLGHPGWDTMQAGAGRDLLRGGRGNDGEPCCGGGLEDGAGDDRVYGGPGVDVLGSPGDVGPGNDVIFGGPGGDVFYQHDGSRDVVNCGSGRELDIQSDGFDVRRSCGARSCGSCQSLTKASAHSFPALHPGLHWRPFFGEQPDLG